MKNTVKRTLRAACRKWAPPPAISIKEWARRYRYLSSIEAARPGKYILEVTPHLVWDNGPLDALDDPAVVEVVCQKSAQVAWTSGVMGNAIGKWIDIDPSPIVVLFPKEGAAKDYMAEKFEPMVEATPNLRAKINLKSRAARQTQTFKRFPGGFLKLVGSNSPASVKSTPTPRIIVEEPDDCNLNIKGQGDSIKLAKERVKTYHRPKIIIGGTPTVADISAIEAEMQLSDKRVGMVPCHECGQEHVLSFDNLECQSGDEQHPVFGAKRPETAYYICPHCGALWDDASKNRNLRRGRWQATAPFRGIAGFYLNELYSTFPGSRLAILKEKQLAAQYEFEKGDPGPLIAFTNSSCGEVYRLQSGDQTEQTLQDRALDYPARTVPAGGLILTAGVDVQHDRIEIVIRAWGRGQESWLVLYERLYGNVKLTTDPVWSDLDRLLQARYRSEKGFALGVEALSIDSSDGNTSDAVYHYVRSRRRLLRHVMAIKGSTNPADEIFRPPRQSVDLNKLNTKAARLGVRPYMVGVSKAKDLLFGDHGRLSLEGRGPGRMHAYKSVNPQYFEQLLNEVKVPIRQKNGNVRYVWQKKPGKPNEALDCEVYALHASRAAKVHLYTDAQWDLLAGQLGQGGLFDEEPAAEETPAEAPAAPEQQDPNPPATGGDNTWPRRRRGQGSRGVEI